MGSEVTMVEYMEQGLLPREDADISKKLGKIFQKSGLEVLAGTNVNTITGSENGSKQERENVKKGNKETLDADIVLSAAGISPNTENIGLEKLGIKTDNGLIKVDEYYRTNVDGVYAIGDIVHGQLWRM